MYIQMSRMLFGGKFISLIVIYFIFLRDHIIAGVNFSYIVGKILTIS